MIIDNNNFIEELDEADNTASTTLKSIHAEGWISWFWTEGCLLLRHPTPGDQFILSTMVKNQGSEDASSVEVTFYSMGSRSWLVTEFPQDLCQCFHQDRV